MAKKRISFTLDSEVLSSFDSVCKLNEIERPVLLNFLVKYANRKFCDPAELRLFILDFVTSSKSL